MKKIFRTVAALAVVMFAGCTTDVTNDVVVPVGGKTTVTIGLEESRTYLGELENGVRKVYWSDDDAVTLNGVASSSIVVAEGNQSATFTFESVAEYPYSILYPAEMYKDANTVTLSATQSSATGTFAKDCAPMSAYKSAEDGTGMTMHHLAGVVRLQMKLPVDSKHTHNIYRVELRGNNNEQVSGDFAIDYQNATLTATSTADADKVVSTSVGTQLNSESATDVFVVVPAQDYTNGFTVRVIDDAGHYMDIKSKACNVEKGEIVAMPAFDFVPTGTLVNIEINSAADLVAFAKAYNDGDYYNVSPFVVHITDDIVFDDATNAAWIPIGNKFGADNKLGLDEGETNYFHGYMEGNGHSIKNWVSSRPLFDYTGSDSEVANLTIDASCTLTANFTDENEYFGALVGYHRGMLENCHCNAALAVTGNWTTVAVGGLIGRIVVGQVENCSMNGDITLDTNFIVENLIYVGGIAGRISNAEGAISNSNFTANITMQGGTKDASKNVQKSLYLGGIVGHTSGSVSNCTTTASKSILASVMDLTAEGATILATNNIYYIYTGGIAGYTNETGVVSGCTNNALTKVQYQRNSDATRSLYIGGISGGLYKKATVQNCTNNGTVQSRSACKTVDVGGIAGLANTESVISNCTNNGDINARSSEKGSYGGRYVYIGGLIGVSRTSLVSNLTNTGSVEVSRVETAKYSTVHLGGIFGQLAVSVDGKNAIKNTGAISLTGNADTHFYNAVGGVAGCLFYESTMSDNLTLSNVANEGAVKNSAEVLQTHAYTGGIVGLMQTASTITNVTNSGAVTNGKANVQHTDMCVGGIVGSAVNITGNKDDIALKYIDVTISNATNSANVQTVGMTGSTANRNTYTGGIIGVLKGSNATISNCTNSGYLYGGTRCNAYPDSNLDSTLVDANGLPCGGTAIGGIAAVLLGTEGSPISVTGCSNLASESDDFDLRASRGYTGGIAGYARYTNISNCTSTNTRMASDNSNSRTAGVVGYLHTSTVSECSVTGLIDGKADGRVGGIAGMMNATSSILKSTFNGAVKLSTGSTDVIAAIVGYTEEGSIVTDCGAKGTIMTSTEAERAITLDDFVGDANATVTGSYLLD